MRIEGNLSKWNEERGFGFITPVSGGRDVFIHISAFPKNGQARLHEPLVFEIEQGKDGKSRAVNVQRPGQLAYRPNNRKRERHAESGFKDMFKTAVILFAIGSFLYGVYSNKSDLNQAISFSVSDAESNVVEEGFGCDGRTLCSEMTSCAEAEFFLKNCPDTQMDGNNDGEPCESQWCSNVY